jgi:hypothetical protein
VTAQADLLLEHLPSVVGQVTGRATRVRLVAFGGLQPDHLGVAAGAVAGRGLLRHSGSMRVVTEAAFGHVAVDPVDADGGGGQGDLTGTTGTWVLGVAPAAIGGGLPVGARGHGQEVVARGAGNARTLRVQHRQFRMAAGARQVVGLGDVHAPSVTCRAVELGFASHVYPMAPGFGDGAQTLHDGGVALPTPPPLVRGVPRDLALSWEEAQGALSQYPHRSRVVARDAVEPRMRMLGQMDALRAVAAQAGLGLAHALPPGPDDRRRDHQNGRCHPDECPPKSPTPAPQPAVRGPASRIGCHLLGHRGTAPTDCLATSSEPGHRSRGRRVARKFRCSTVHAMRWRRTSL